MLRKNLRGLGAAEAHRVGQRSLGKEACPRLYPCNILAELIAACYPVMPVLDDLLCLVISFNGCDLREWYSQCSPRPLHRNKHFVQAVITGSHFYDFDFFSYF